MLRSTSKFFFFFFFLVPVFGFLLWFRRSVFASGIGESGGDIFFGWAFLVFFCEEGKTCPSGLGGHSDDVEYIWTCNEIP